MNLFSRNFKISHAETGLERRQDSKTVGNFKAEKDRFPEAPSQPSQAYCVP